LTRAAGLANWLTLSSPRVWGNRALTTKVTTFGLIGVLNTLVEYGVFLLVRAALSRSAAALVMLDTVAAFCHYGDATTALLIAANITSWQVAATGSYVMNSLITFAVESGRQLRWRDYISFVVSGIAGLIANTATLIIAAEVLLLPILLAKAVAILATFVVNFSLSHLVVFRARRGFSTVRPATIAAEAMPTLPPSRRKKCVRS
jgi:putative flippase GtrA